MSAGYRWCIEDSAYAALASLKKRSQQEVIAALDRIAAKPFPAPPFTARDGDGFEIGICFLGNRMISYHVDHAARMVHVRDITPLS